MENSIWKISLNGVEGPFVYQPLPLRRHWNDGNQIQTSRGGRLGHLWRMRRGPATRTALLGWGPCSSRSSRGAARPRWPAGTGQCKTTRGRGQRRSRKSPSDSQASLPSGEVRAEEPAAGESSLFCALRGIMSSFGLRGRLHPWTADCVWRVARWVGPGRA